MEMIFFIDAIYIRIAVDKTVTIRSILKHPERNAILKYVQGQQSPISMMAVPPVPERTLDKAHAISQTQVAGA